MEILIDHSSLLHIKYPWVAERFFGCPLNLFDLLNKACQQFSEHQYRESAHTFITGYWAKGAYRDRVVQDHFQQLAQRVKFRELSELFDCDEDVNKLDTLGLFCLHGAALALFLEKSEDKLSVESILYRPFPGFGGQATQDSVKNEKELAFGLTIEGPWDVREINWKKQSNIAEMLPLLDNIGRLIEDERPRDIAGKLAEWAIIESTTISMICGKEELQSDLVWVFAKTCRDELIGENDRKKLMEVALQRVLKKEDNTKIRTGVLNEWSPDCTPSP
jgi:hypothetical protein